jgi:hypothetical protein
VEKIRYLKEGDFMNSKKCFDLITTLATFLIGFNTALLGQEAKDPNDEIKALKEKVEQLESIIEAQQKTIKRFESYNERLKKENERLKKLCSQAGIDLQDSNSSKPIKTPHERFEVECQRQFRALIENKQTEQDRIRKDLDAVLRGRVGFTIVKPPGNERHFPASSIGMKYEKGSASRFSNQNNYYQDIVWQFQDIQTKTYWRKHFEDELKTIDEKLEDTTLANFEPVILLDELEVGKIGKLEYPNYVVGTTPSVINANVLQIFSESDMLVRVFGQTIWITRYSTSGLVTDKSINLKGFFEIIGTKTYESALGGSNTVFVLKHLKIDDL